MGLCSQAIEQDLKIFIVTRTPHRLAQIFWENEKMVFMGTTIEQAVLEVGHYLGPPIQEENVVRHERKRCHGRFQLLVESSRAHVYEQFVEQQRGALMLKPFKAIEALDLRKEARLQTILINCEEDRHKLAGLPLAQVTNLQIVQQCRFPS